MAVPQNITCSTHRTRFWNFFQFVWKFNSSQPLLSWPKNYLSTAHTKIYVLAGQKMWYHLIWDETPNAHLISSYSGLIWIHNFVFPHSFSPSPQSTMLHELFITAYTFEYLLNPNFNMSYQWKIPSIPHFFIPHVDTGFNPTAGVLMY